MVGKKVSVNTNGVNLRTEPGTNSKIAGTVNFTTLPVTTTVLPTIVSVDGLITVLLLLLLVSFGVWFVVELPLFSVYQEAIHILYIFSADLALCSYRIWLELYF